MTLTAAEECELLTLLEAEARELFPDTGPYRRELYPKHTEFFRAGAQYRERLFIAGNRCITPWTPIEMGHATRLASEVAAETPFDVRSFDGDSRCTRQASGVFLKGIEPAFRIHLDNGQFFDCSRRHQVLTVFGWREVFQLIHGASGLHCWQTAQDSPASYGADGCHGDAPLLAAQGTVQEQLPSRDGVRRRCHSGVRVGVKGRESQYTHVSQSFFPLSIPATSPLFWDLCEQFQDPTERLNGLMNSHERHTMQQWMRACLHEQGAEQGPHVQCDVQSFWHAAPVCHVALDRFALPIASSQDDQLSLAWKAPGQSIPGWWHDVEHTQIFFPSSHLHLIGGQRIESIVQLGYQPIIDFTVEDVHCYESGGVIHHNTGKSLAACYEATCHLTGIYPHWWEGKRFVSAIRCWVAGTHSKKVKESVQEILFGPVGAWGSGLIPRETIRRITRASGSVPDLIDTAWVRHTSGGWSTVTLKYYEQGREAFEATQADVILEDEEPPLTIHAECLLRTMDTSGSGQGNGLVMTTFTPLQGLSDTVVHFLPDGQLPASPAVAGRYIVNASWDDVPHLDATTKAELLASIPAYQRDARTRGIPVLAAGVIYPVAEDVYLLDPVELAPHWKRAYGMDVGWNRTAAVWGAYDADSDVWYLYSEHYLGHAEPSVHAAGIRGRGEWIPGVIDPASRGRSQVDGRQLLEDYQQLGLQLTPAVAAVEAGIYQVLDRLATGRLKVFRTLTNFRTEIRLYRRDEKGHVIKLSDHLMDSCKYLMMSGLEVARAETPRRLAPQGLPLAGTPQGWMA